MNQGEPLPSGPSLELSFAPDHVCRSVELFNIDQPRHPVFPSEAFDQPLLVLEDAALEVALVEPM